MPLLTILYACAVFLSAFLLFLVQPLVARQLLPILGGSSAVWTTCLVFFQSALVLGYLYADILIRRLRPRSQAVTHIGVLIIAVAMLGLRVHPNPWAATWHPTLTVLGLLTTIIGLPYLALSATTPLLQAWFTRSFHSAFPYRFYSLSNIGSLLALLVYPVILEPHLALKAQTLFWSTAFFFFAVICGGLAWNARKTLPEAAVSSEPSVITWRQRSLWLLLPACGSLLLCAFTSHLSQNIAAIPLLWIAPLAAYLLSFIIAFHSPRAYPRWLMLRLTAFALATLGYVLYDVHTTIPLQIAIPLYCILLFVLCLFFHGEVYRLRPAASGATEFYLLLALGSALGSAFVGIIAPNLFRANYELCIGLICAALLAMAVTWNFGWMTRGFWAALSVALIVVATIQARAWQQDAIVQLRSFYGTLRVTETHWPPYADTTRTLYHGTIQHGAQFYGNGMRMQPRTYYAPDSGVGLALRLCCEQRSKRVAIVGLGAGALAAYGQPGDLFRFYEINPQVDRIARHVFTYLRETPAKTDVIFGDARSSISHDSSAPFDVIVLDAFSGDAVPVHLLTQQAIALYRKHITPDGILAFHISSQYLDLEPVLAREAQQAGMHAITVDSAGDDIHGIFAADWVLLTNNQQFLDQPTVKKAAEPSPTRDSVPLWTDDYSSVLSVIEWKPRLH